MSVELLCLLMLAALRQPGGPLGVDRAIEDVRAQLRQLWNEVLVRNHNETACTFTGLRSFHQVHGGFKSMDATAGELESLIFYQHECTDLQPPKGSCEGQQKDGSCQKRLSGILQDGLCARTCGLCNVQNVSDIGMRATFAFPRAWLYATTSAKRRVIVFVEPSGRVGHYELDGSCKANKGGVYCNGKRSFSHKQLRVYVLGQPWTGGWMDG